MSEVGESAGVLFHAGRLDDAVAAANAAVRKAPAELAPRILLAELLVFAGNLERADVILDAASLVDPQAGMVVAEFRQLLRADKARRQLRRDGRLPEFLGAPTETMAAVLEAHVALRSGDAAGAAAMVARAEELRPRAAGTAVGGTGEVTFDDFRDADDLNAGFFEVLTTTGKYFWIPTERIESIEFHQPKRARDLCWRRVSMSVRDGPDGDVYLPAIYGNEEPARGDEFRLGRATDWVQPDGDFVLGIGQRVFLAGEEPVSIMALNRIDFDVRASVS